MSWAVGGPDQYGRWVGYGVPAYCDHPKCDKKIDRGLAYVCGDQPQGGEHGCGLHFCPEHLAGEHNRCPRCRNHKRPYTPKPEHPEWVEHVATDPSWAAYRATAPGARWLAKHAASLAAPPERPR